MMFGHRFILVKKKINSMTIYSENIPGIEEDIPDLFKALKVEKSATTKEIKAAYRKMALNYHPDKQAGKTAEEIQETSRIFKEITGYRLAY